MHRKGEGKESRSRRKKVKADRQTDDQKGDGHEWTTEAERAQEEREEEWQAEGYQDRERQTARGRPESDYYDPSRHL